MKEGGCGIDIDEHAVCQRLMQPFKILTRDRSGPQGDEASEVITGFDQRVYVGEEGQAHHVFDRAFAQCVTHVCEVSVLGSARRVTAIICGIPEREERSA